MLEEPTKDWKDPLESIGEEEWRTEEDQHDPKSEAEERSSILSISKQLEVLLKMIRPDFNELVKALKGGSSKSMGF
jgi:hypothetical protein